MKPTTYQQALTGLKRDECQKVETALNEWANNPEFSQIAQNIYDETALSLGEFKLLLKSFADQLEDDSTSSFDAWIKACRQNKNNAHKLKGLKLPDSKLPVVLGRVLVLEDYAALMGRDPMGLTPLEAERQIDKLIEWLRDKSGKRKPNLEIFLCEAPLGKYLVWATFNSTKPDQDPFGRHPEDRNGLPGDRDGIRTALALGHLPPEEDLILLVWNHADFNSPPLFRPTVADAEANPYYRPCQEATKTWGLTKPLLPNPRQLQSQPEVIMNNPGKGLIFSFHVV